jgi:hypothetical protein
MIATSRSKPNSERNVLRYSVAHRRRGLKNPGCDSTALTSVFRYQASTRSTSASVGCGSFSGGICRSSRTLATDSQTSNLAATFATVIVVKSTPPFASLPLLWQVTQYFFRNGWTVSSNGSSAATVRQLPRISSKTKRCTVKESSWNGRNADWSRAIVLGERPCWRCRRVAPSEIGVVTVYSAGDKYMPTSG